MEEIDYINRPKLYTSKYVIERILSKFETVTKLDQEGNIVEWASKIFAYNDKDGMILLPTRSNTLRPDDNGGLISDSKEPLDESALIKVLVGAPVGTEIYYQPSNTENAVSVLATKEFDGWKIEPFGKYVVQTHGNIPYLSESRIISILTEGK